MKWVIAALVAFIASSTLLGVSVLRLKGDLKASVKSIEDPKTGYKVKLATAETGLATCKADAAINLATMAEQSAAVEALQAERDRAVSEGQKALRAAQRETEGAKRAIARVRGMQPKSSEYCAQAHELEEFLRGPQP
jgi:hypothetical protein